MTAATDRRELRELVETYAAAVDTADAAAVAALFTAGGALVLFMDPASDAPTGERRGREEIEAALVGLRRYRATHHTISSQVVRPIDADTAGGTTRCVAHHVEPDSDGDGWHDRVLYARYDDEFVRIGGRWLFARRELHVQWVSVLPVSG